MQVPFPHPQEHVPRSITRPPLRRRPRGQEGLLTHAPSRCRSLGSAEYRRLWAAATVSAFGTQVTLLALPLVAALVLRATPLQMGILVAAEYLPTLVLGLVAGAWIDRRHRRPILIASDLGRAVLLLSVPIAAVLGVLRIEQL